MVSNLKMQLDICYVVMFCLLKSSARSSFLSVSHRGPHMSIGESRNSLEFFIINFILLVFVRSFTSKQELSSKSKQSR